jgi:putative redox protein
MPDPLLTITAALTDDKVHFRASARNNPVIELDYTPPLGTGDGYMPLELFLASLAVCSASTIATLLRRMGRTIDAMEITATGNRRAEHPTSFEEIDLFFAIHANDVTAQDVDKAVELSRNTYCPVWVMISDTVRVLTRYRIEGASTE